MPENNTPGQASVEKIPDCVDENSGPLTVEHVRRFKEVMREELEKDPRLFIKIVHPLLKRDSG